MTTADSVEKRIQALEQSQAVCGFRFSSASEDIQELRRAIEDLVSAIRGNGHEGLLARVVRNETWVKVIWAITGTHTVTLIALVGWLITKEL